MREGGNSVSSMRMYADLSIFRVGSDTNPSSVIPRGRAEAREGIAGPLIWTPQSVTILDPSRQTTIAVDEFASRASLPDAEK